MFCTVHLEREVHCLVWGEIFNVLLDVSGAMRNHFCNGYMFVDSQVVMWFNDQCKTEEAAYQSKRVLCVIHVNGVLCYRYEWCILFRDVPETFSTTEDRIILGEGFLGLKM